MIQIDDNTFIDDTLITCVEYQKFVDELRANGKHVQPDHWQSPTFSKGESLKPIVGTRFSDAQAFCAWLTNREHSKWRYRLPTTQETKDYPLNQRFSIPIGYWTSSGNVADFVWINKPPDHWQEIKMHITKNVHTTISRIAAEIPEYKKSLELAKSKNIKAINTSNNDFGDILCRASDFDQADIRLIEIIRLTDF